MRQREVGVPADSLGCGSSSPRVRWWLSRSWCGRAGMLHGMRQWMALAVLVVLGSIGSIGAARASVAGPGPSIPVPGAAPHASGGIRGRAAARPGPQRLCTSFLSTSAVGAITGLATKPYGVTKYLKRFGVAVSGSSSRERIPGSICGWIDNTAPAAGLENTASLLVGYGESQAGWTKVVSYFKAGAPESGYPIGIADTPTYSPLDLGYGSKSFLTTVDLGKYYGFAAGQFPGISPYLYAVTVLTKHHNILQVWFINALASNTEAWAGNTVKRDRAFF